jgi:hypothetical protein
MSWSPLTIPLQFTSIGLALEDLHIIATMQMTSTIMVVFYLARNASDKRGNSETKLKL